MSEEGNNKKRSKNFTGRETLGLLSLISQKKSIIENKKTDAATNRDKLEAWQEIAKAFNATCAGEPRSAESLKKYWDNQKRLARKLKGEERKEVLLTGGGPQPNKMDSNMNLIMSILDPLTVVGGEGRYVSDGQTLNLNQDQGINKAPDACSDDYFEFEYENDFASGINDTVMDNINVDMEEACCSGLTQTPKANWKIYCMSDLQKPKSSSLKRPLEDEGENEENMTKNTNPTTPVVDSNGLHDGKTVQNTNQVNQRPPNRRRPNSTVLRSLAGNELAEKYNMLADKKSVIADLLVEKIRKEIRNMDEEHSLKVEIMQLEKKIKKEQFASLRPPNF